MTGNVNEESEQQDGKIRLAIFASGKGTTAQAILEYYQKNNDCSYKPVLIVSSSPKAGVLDIAEEYDIPASVIREQEYSEYDEFCDTLFSVLKIHSVEFIALAGYLRKVPPSLLKKYPRSIVNTHPALLPKYGGQGMYGMNVHTAVSESGDSQTGCTVHWVDEEYDEGQIIDQCIVEISPHAQPDMIAEQVQTAERQFYPFVLNRLLSAMQE
ncbi:MAG: phosphoribosylglycinamide formyltransferase [Candidatus Kapabacteria bacterium]|nr:phosphoribosylglycinamide formyltransferase [Candidatus Kapabacteria bacterium]